MKYYLVNLDAKEICGASDKMEELIAIGDKHSFAYDVPNSEKFASYTLVELVRLYNNLPGVKERIERFSDKAAAMRRINEAVERGGVNEPRKGKKPVKARKKKADGGNAGRKAGWNTVLVSAAGKSDDVSFHKENPRYKVFEVIKRREEVEREALVKFCEDSLGIKRAQVMGAVGKLLKRGLVRAK